MWLGDLTVALDGSLRRESIMAREKVDLQSSGQDLVLFMSGVASSFYHPWLEGGGILSRPLSSKANQRWEMFLHIALFRRIKIVNISSVTTVQGFLLI